MAHSLEATIVLPIVLSCLAGFSAQVLPVLKAHDRLARSLMVEQKQQLTLEHLYQMPEGSQVVLTSPQQMVAWIFLAQDVSALLEP